MFFVSVNYAEKEFPHDMKDSLFNLNKMDYRHYS